MEQAPHKKNFKRSMGVYLSQIRQAFAAAVHRFPLSVGLSVLLWAVLIALGQMDISVFDRFESVSPGIGRSLLGAVRPLLLLLPWSAAYHLWQEAHPGRISCLGPVLFLVGSFAGWYAYFYNLGSQSPRHLQFGLFFAASLLLLLICGRKKPAPYYESYVLSILRGAGIALGYALVLYLGLIAILFTIQALFQIKVASFLFSALFETSLCLLFVPLGLSYVPLPSQQENPVALEKAVQGLLFYIVMPLTVVYGLILYAYFAKVLYQRVLPKNLISHLVLWYGLLSVGILFLNRTFTRQNPFFAWYQRHYPKWLLPLFAMMFFSLSQRLFQYGFTPPRYFALVAGLWVSAVTLLEIGFRRPSRSFWMVSSAIAVLIFSSAGPLSSRAVSLRSQNSRLRPILARQGLLGADGRLDQAALERASSKSSAEKKQIQADYREIQSILGYLKREQALEQSSLLATAKSYPQIEKQLSDLTGRTSSQEAQESVYVQLSMRQQEQKAFAVKTKAYPYVVFLPRYLTPARPIQVQSQEFEATVHLLSPQGKLRLEINGQSADFDLNENGLLEQAQSQELSPQALTFTAQAATWQAELLCRELSYQKKQDGEIQIDGIEAILLLTLK